MLRALIGLTIAAVVAVQAFRSGNTGLGIGVAVLGVVLALYRVRRGG